MAQVDYFLKVESIDGESLDEKHKGEIDVLSWSWGATNSGLGQQLAGGKAQGKVVMGDFTFTHLFSKASPKLLLACATGEHFPKAVLTVRKAGKEQQEYLVWTFTEVFVTSYNTGGGGGEGNIHPIDQISMTYTKMEVEYKAQKPDGGLESPVKTGYDLKSNKKV